MDKSILHRLDFRENCLLYVRVLLIQASLPLESSDFERHRLPFELLRLTNRVCQQEQLVTDRSLTFAA
jgi:hypothetical protein